MRILILILLLLTTPALAEIVQFPGPDGVTLKAELLRPAGPVTAPAIVALHGCGGPFPKRDQVWAKMLTDAGHIVLLPDSFASRGLGPQCRERNRVATSAGLRRRDAIASAVWLAGQPGTPAGGVVLLGWSDGGSTVLAAGHAAPDLPAGLLRGMVAFYPGCRGPALAADWVPAAPMLVLIGASDDWTPAAPCIALADRLAAKGIFTLQVYPGAYHDFDVVAPVRVLQSVPFSQNADKTVHVGGDPAARADAITRVTAFLAGLPAVR